MNFQEYYTINIKVNDSAIDIDPKSFSFSMSDSIYSLYPTASFRLKDSTGLLQEVLGVESGNKASIEYGSKNKTFKSPYILIENTFRTPEDPGFLSGDVDIELIHEWYNEQVIESRAFEDRLSRIVRDFTSNYNFKRVDIDDTGNQDIWYQPNITRARFINEIALKYAYSRNASRTPFYAFIANDNVFHFRNLQSMMDEDKVGTIEYKIDPGSSREKSDEEEGSTKTQQIQRWTPNYKSLWLLKHKDAYFLNNETGKFEKQTLNLTEYPDKTNLSLPIANDTGGINSFEFLGRTKENTGEKENNLGKQINAMRDGMLYDRFLILQPLNPNLQSGKKVSLIIHSRQRDGQQISKRFSGDYVIENCEHIWSGEDTQGYTKIIIGRKYIQVPNSYTIKPTLM